jgi:hypothetical protein
MFSARYLQGIHLVKKSLNCGLWSVVRHQTPVPVVYRLWRDVLSSIVCRLSSVT